MRANVYQTMVALIALLALAAVLVLAVAAAIAFGGPRRPEPMESVSDGFRAFDLMDLPPVRRFAARDGTELCYRAYASMGTSKDACAVLIHGSASRSDRVHSLARGFAWAGYAVLVPDVRGHGESGQKGCIGYIGQLEDDLEDLMAAHATSGRTSLVGFSAGGGFALRFAADRRAGLFRNYLLMAPFLNQSASTYRPGSGGWISVGLPRILGLLLLNALGIKRFNGLPVSAFALSPKAQEQLTGDYSYSLAMNFRPHNDYRADIAAAASPLEVLVGANDDQFYAERFADDFKASRTPTRVTVLDGVGHIDLTTSKVAVSAAVEALGRMNETSDRA